MKGLEVRSYYYEDDGKIPNNVDLPALLYVGALKEKPEQTEKIFNSHNWRNSWTNGVFRYHHYHSNVHEVLGSIRGSATLQLGGEQGDQVVVEAGDVLVLPAGTGHKRLSASSDFQVVGAYPEGMDYNLRRGLADERPEVLEEIRQVPLPLLDPIYGENGPLVEKWHKSK
ncbi:hypothetical protein EHS13_34660 [Paenibacillus psychroresistens]|uniref:Uncharacterized protein n=1 Tax=Paenibacillus psychroresistens TaxID=1778678 RepID=A0A6B8RW60_9BACL|nr:cupin domain-containing protein [Paenibacillus psychroresistens]QGQ99643.1 hypothetical protein EHS13_34660 [Paenibacillus psychroresistens]